MIWHVKHFVVVTREILKSFGILCKSDGWSGIQMVLELELGSLLQPVLCADIMMDKYNIVMRDNQWLS